MKKIFIFLLIIFFISLTSKFIVDAFIQNKADTVYLNGDLYTLDAKFSKVHALAIKGQKLIYVGDNKAVKNYIGSNTKVVDLHGKTVIPGLYDGHLHFPEMARNSLQIDVFNQDKQAILNLVKQQAALRQPGEWIIGRGWNQALWDDPQFPTKEELDEVAPNNPVVLKRVDLHSIWVNSKALELAHITKDTPNPEGGEILRNTNHAPSGMLTDTAQQLVLSKIPALSAKELAVGLLKAQEILFSQGITSATDAGSTLAMINEIKRLYESGELKIRLNIMLSNGLNGEKGNTLTYYYKKGPEIGLYGDRLTVRSIKIVGDGSLGSHSAALLESYHDHPGDKGQYRFTNDELYNLVKEARRHGWQVATHAIGDGAILQAIDVYDRVLKENPLPDHRWRIEHFQFANADEIKRLVALGIIPSMMPVHATSDKNIAEDRVGHERMQYAYAWRKILNAGAYIVGGSDAPVELVNPFHGLYAAVTRMDRAGNPPGGWYGDEKMTREEALRAFTIWAAKGSFDEKLKGSLEIGKLADFIVIEKDPLHCPADELKDIKVSTTVLGGAIVYHNN